MHYFINKLLRKQCLIFSTLFISYRIVCINLIPIIVINFKYMYIFSIFLQQYLHR